MTVSSVKRINFRHILALEKDGFNAPDIISSLRKSKVRSDTLDFLISIYPTATYPYHIARELGYKHSDVIQAIRGGRGYSADKSLISLGLVEVIDGRRGKMYKAATAAKRIFNLT